MREYNAMRYDPEAAKAYQSRRREIYKEKKEKGICVRCSKPATHGLYCYECSIKQKRQSQQRSAIRKNERHDRGLIPEYRKKNELCLWCGKKTVKGLNCCDDHGEKFSAAGRKGYEQNLVNKNNPWINELEAWKKMQILKKEQRSQDLRTI